MFKKIKLLLFKAKWDFKKPKKRDVLIYDYMSINNGFVKNLFSKKSYEIIHVRYETINFYVLLSTLIKHGFKDIVNNYKKTFFNFVSPKIIYSGVDSHTSFYKLKHIYKKATFINDQYGISKVTGKGWPNEFCWDLKNYYKKNKKKPFVDIMFVFGNNEKKRLKPIIDGKYFVLGNTKNNSFPVHKKVKKNDITYICSGLWQPSWNRQCKVFKLLSKYCENKNIRLNFIPKKPQKKFASHDESYYRKKLGKGKWHFVDHSKKGFNIYNFINTQKLIVFAHSTLGFEALSKGIKVLVFTSDFPEKNSSKYYKKNGLFWTDSLNYKILSSYVDKVAKMKKKDWKRIYKKYSYEILSFDKNNYKKKKIINSILKK